MKETPAWHATKCDKYSHNPLAWDVHAVCPKSLPSAGPEGALSGRSIIASWHHCIQRVAKASLVQRVKCLCGALPRLPIYVVGIRGGTQTRILLLVPNEQKEPLFCRRTTPAPPTWRARPGSHAASGRTPSRAGQGVHTLVDFLNRKASKRLEETGAKIHRLRRKKSFVLTSRIERRAIAVCAGPGAEGRVAERRKSEGRPSADEWLGCFLDILFDHKQQEGGEKELALTVNASQIASP